MLLRRKQKPDADEQLIPHVLTWRSTECEEVGRSKSRTAQVAKFSKLSAQMVELSLREAPHDPTLPGTISNKLSAVSSPVLRPSTDVQRIAKLPAESAERQGTAAVAAATPLNPPQWHGTPREWSIPNFAVLYSRATIIFRETTNYWNEVHRTPRYWLARRIRGSLTIAAQRTELIRQRTALSIGRWSRWVATTAQFLASANLRILAHSQPLRRLKHACRNNFRVTRAPSVCAVIEKKFAAWNLRRESLEPDSRLWTSMGMAALSALLALSVISSVRRYAPSPDTPKHIDRHTPSDVSPVIPATQGISQPRRSPVAHADSGAASAAVPHPARTLAAQPEVVKTRHREDDDYVARDTYIYYGNKGKPSR